MTTSVFKTDVLKYLADTRAHMSAYHNHKETSAWAGLVLFVLIVAQLVGVLGAGAGLCANVCATAAVLFVSVGVGLHIRQQLYLRKIAADITSACVYLGADILPRSQDEVSRLDFSLTTADDGVCLADHDLPKFVRDRAGIISGKGQYSRRVLEVGIFLLMAAIVLLAIIRIWR